jgi:hypothetical protein
MHIVDMKVDFDIQGMAVQFDNLFNGNKVLGEWPQRSTAYITLSMIVKPDVPQHMKLALNI